jgi:hypothetical protein
MPQVLFVKCIIVNRREGLKVPMKQTKILAAQEELEREQNRCQVIQKMKSGLETGY